MNKSEMRRLAATFIVRLWTEHAEDEAPQWRGQVEHIQSGAKEYFPELGKMLDFITDQCKEQQEQRSDKS